MAEQRRLRRWRGICLGALLTLGAAPALQAAPEPAPPEPGTPLVEIYTSAGCGYCKALKVYLGARDIPYVEHNINATLETRQAFFAMGGRGTPLVVIGERRIHGFNPARIEAALSAVRDTAEPAAPPR